MTNKELELIGQLTEVAMTVTELKAENKILKDINEKLMQALRIHDVVGQAEDLLDKIAQDEGFGNWETVVLNCHHSVIRSVAIAAVIQALRQPFVVGSVCTCTKFRETPMINGKHICSICNKPIARKRNVTCEFHCERFDFGRDKKCEQQCSDCHWMQTKLQ